ncbi:MAG: NAD(P)/FAD-dependent oxidoreductase [Muribaculaceae bacterium]|nr:NAD(P)/FAD-dependent oxidoreductase [Muribaculaceae bacterium]
MERIVIIGGGFAGLNLVKYLDKDKFEVMLIDRDNFHCFPPLFYQVASSGLAPENICFPFRRELLRHTNVSYHMGHVKDIDLEAKKVTTSYETLEYDKLVIAAGSANNYFGNDSLRQTTFGIKTISQAAHTRDEIIDRLERASICDDPERRKQLLSFLVVGGGPAGVEIAGSIGEMKKYVLPKEYPGLNADDLKITLVEGAGKLLGAMSEKSSKKALEYLSKDLLVDVRLNTLLQDYTDKIVTFADGKKEYWETVIWTAGVKGETMPGLSPEFVGRGGRIPVDKFNRVIGHEADVMAVGDIACMITDDYPHGHPQMAQPAIQQARNLAKNLNKGEFVKEFKYYDKGSMATVGKNRAVADLKCCSLSGFIAWFAWMAIHLLSLLGMRNKVTVFLNWIWNYFTYSSSLRLRLLPTKYPLRRHWGD